MRTLHPGCSCGIEAPPQLWSGDPACPEHLGDPFGTFQRFNVQMRTFHPGRIYGTFRRSLLAFPARPRPPVISNGASRLFSSASLLRMRRPAQREISLLLFLVSAF